LRNNLAHMNISAALTLSFYLHGYFCCEPSFTKIPMIFSNLRSRELYLSYLGSKICLLPFALVIDGNVGCGYRVVPPITTSVRIGAKAQ